MILRTWGHSCVSLEDEEHCLVLDPGTWSRSADVLARATAVLVSHDHADHLDVAAVLQALDASPGLEVWGPSSVHATLVEAGAPPGRVHAVVAGTLVEAAGVRVRAVGGAHAQVHPDVPVAPNLGFLVAGVYHPGDSVEPPEEPVEVLLAPVAGPWLRLADTVDLVRAVRPRVVVPIHDAILSTQGQALVDRVLGALGGCPVTRLAVGEPLAEDGGRGGSGNDRATGAGAR